MPTMLRKRAAQKWRTRATMLICALLWTESIVAADPPTLTYRGKVRLPVDTAVDQRGAAFNIVGLSGISFRDDDNFIAVMDNSDKLVRLRVKFKPDGSIATVDVADGLTLANNRDYEGIACTSPKRNTVFLSNEATPPPPTIFEYNLLNGALVQTVKLPAVFMHQVDNRGLESLALRPDGKEMWTANEEALSVDDTASSGTKGSAVRLLRLTVEGDTITPAEQYAYVVEPCHAGIGLPLASGLCDLLVLPDGRLLTLERSAREGLPLFESRIYLVDFTGATDISKGALAEGLRGQPYKPVAKTLLLSASKIGENLEGLCLGPKLSGGGWALLGVVDSGSPDPVSKNTLVAFEFLDPAPVSFVPMATGAAGIAVILLIAIGWAFSSRRRRAAG